MEVEIIKRESKHLAYVTGILWWKKLYIHTKFTKLSKEMQCAVIAHELGHIKHFHTEQRILCILFLPFLYVKLCRWQEFQADSFAASLGFADPLRYLLCSLKDVGGLVHPTHRERVKNLEKYA